jgi:hypothetical protein
MCCVNRRHRRESCRDDFPALHVSAALFHVSRAVAFTSVVVVLLFVFVISEASIRCYTSRHHCVVLVAVSTASESAIVLTVLTAPNGSCVGPASISGI